MRLTYNLRCVNKKMTVRTVPVVIFLPVSRGFQNVTPSVEYYLLYL